jgi:hypothetical protein
MSFVGTRRIPSNDQGSSLDPRLPAPTVARDIINKVAPKQEINTICSIFDRPEYARVLRVRLNGANADTACDYILAEELGINIEPETVTYKIQLVVYLATDEAVNKLHFREITAWQISTHLYHLRKWIGYYNHKVLSFLKFYRRLYYSDNPRGLSLARFHGEHSQLNSNERSIYNADDLRTQEDITCFLKWTPSAPAGKRDKAIF